MELKANKKKVINEIGFYTDIGFRFVIIIIVFLFLGDWLDNKTGYTPVFTMVFVFLGASAGFYNLYRGLVSNVRKKEKK